MHTLKTQFKKTSDGWKITKLTKLGMGPDKHTLGIIGFEGSTAIVSLNTFYKIEGVDTDEPLVLYYSNSTNKGFADRDYKAVIYELITDESAFNNTLDIIKNNAHFKNILGPISEIFRRQYKLRLNDFK